MKNQPVQTGDPARQGFYLVSLAANPSERFVAEWREYSKKDGKRWWRHVSDDPTVAKKPTPLDGVLNYANASKEEVVAALARTLTVEERIENAYQTRLGYDRIYPPYVLEIPERRRMKVGDAGVVGNLKDVRIVDIRDNGQMVIFQYHDLKKVYGKEVDGGIRYGANHWTEILPLNPASSSEVRRTRDPVMYGGYSNSTVSSMLSRTRIGLEDSPDYQRGYVWSAEDKHRYLDSLFNGRDLGRFIFVEHAYPRRMAILDGKQRLNCLTEFFSGALAYEGVYYDQLSRGEQHTVAERSLQFADLPGTRYTKKDLLRIFLEVNAGGVPQTPEHLALVRHLVDVEEAIEVLETLDADSKIADVYDDSPSLQDALKVLYPDFEYPNHSYRKVGDVLKAFRKA